METNKKTKRETKRDSKPINGKYDIIIFYEDLIKKGVKEAKTSPIY